MAEQTEIGAYETKRRLAAFLRDVQGGRRYTITQRGRPVAELVPYGTSRGRAKTEAAQAMKAYMQTQTPGIGTDIRALIEEGRD